MTSYIVIRLDQCPSWYDDDDLMTMAERRQSTIKKRNRVGRHHKQASRVFTAIIDLVNNDVFFLA